MDAEALATFVSIYTKALEIVIGVLLAEMILVGFAAVIARYLLSSLVSLYWADEMIRYSFIWSVFLVSPLVIRRGANLDLDIFVRLFPQRVRWVIALVNAVVILVFLLVLIVHGVVMIRVNLTHLSAALEISLAWVYLAVPIGGLMMLGEYIVILIGLWRGSLGETSQKVLVPVE